MTKNTDSSDLTVCTCCFGAALHQWNCPSNPDSPFARSKRAADAFTMQLEDRAKATILELIRKETAPLVARVSELELLLTRDRDTQPAPSPDSWSGAHVVPRGSSRPPAPGCAACGMLACVCALGRETAEGGLE